MNPVRMFDAFLDLLFPRRSLRGEEGGWITGQEMALLRAFPVIADQSMLRMLGLLAVDRIVAAGEYRDAALAREAIHAFKYGRVRALGIPLAQLMTEASHSLSSDSSCVLCPVPLHFSRRFQRGFNQSQELAKKVAAARGWSCCDLLRRTRPTGTQTTRGRSERFAAMQGAFRARCEPVASHIILVDDLWTTGATLDACAAALKRAGAQRVEGLVVAHA